MVKALAGGLLREVCGGAGTGLTAARACAYRRGAGGKCLEHLPPLGKSPGFFLNQVFAPPGLQFRVGQTHLQAYGVNNESHQDAADHHGQHVNEELLQRQTSFRRTCPQLR